MQKLYYSISEVSQMVNEPQYVLRYWEKEFPLLKPKKNRAGNRVYSDKDIEIIQTIKSLLREQKLSLRGALAELERIYGKKQNLSIKQQVDSKDNYKPKSLFKIPEKQTLFDYDLNFKINLQEIRKKINSILEIAKKL